MIMHVHLLSQVSVDGHRCNAAQANIATFEIQYLGIQKLLTCSVKPTAVGVSNSVYIVESLLVYK